MSIFRDRYVLNYRTITPDEVEGITIDRRTSEVYFNLIDDEVCEVENMIRLDLATGMKDFYENDRVLSDTGMTGTVAMIAGAWCIKWDKLHHETSPLHGQHDYLTITGMVPWEETNA